MFDTDAQSFFTRSGVTDATQQNAVNQLVLDLKAAGVWTKLDLIYPFVGGTESTHKHNLKSSSWPFNDGELATGHITHNSGGVQSDGSYDAVMVCDYLIQNHYSNSLTAYCRTEAPSSFSMADGICGFCDGTYALVIHPHNYSTSDSSLYYAANGTPIQIASTDGQGCFTVNRTADNVWKAFKNGVQQGSTQTTVVGGGIGYRFRACGTYAAAMTGLLAFAAAGPVGLTDTEVTALHTAIETCQTALGRGGAVVAPPPTGLWYTCGTVGLQTLGWAVSPNIIEDYNRGRVQMYGGPPEFKQPDGTIYSGDDVFSTTQLGPKQFKHVADWGYVTVTYSDSGDHLYLDLDIANDTDDHLNWLGLLLLWPTFSGNMTKWMHNPDWTGAGGSSMPNDYEAKGGWPEGPPVVGIDAPDCVINICCDIGMMNVSVVSVGTGGQTIPMLSSYIYDVPALSTLGVRFVLRFYPPGSGVMLQEPDIEATFRAAQPQISRWNDIRPIATLFLASTGIDVATNPNRWILNYGNIDTSTPEGLAAFQGYVLAYADGAIACLRQYGCQGMITWDIEGQRTGMTYYGSPELNGEITGGEMSSMVTVDGVTSTIATAYFKKFTDAGFRVGVCIRPSRCYFAGGYWNQESLDVAGSMDDLRTSLDYAIENWGCSLFYIDSTVDSDNRYLDVDFWKTLRGEYPDVLMAPENQTLGAYASTTPLDSYTHMGVAKTMDKVRRVWPRANALILAMNGIAPADEAAVMQGMAEGDIYLITGWYPNPEAQQIHDLYMEVYPAGAFDAGPRGLLAFWIGGANFHYLPRPPEPISPPYEPIIGPDGPSFLKRHEGGRPIVDDSEVLEFLQMWTLFNDVE